MHELPWHRRGVYIPAHIETAAEALAFAGASFEVERHGVEARFVDRLRTDPEGAKLIPSLRAIARMDTREILSVVSDRYRPIQNVQAFSWLDPLVARGQLAYEMVGVIGNGERVWLLAKLAGFVSVGDYTIDRYLLGVNTHDASMASQVLFLPIERSSQTSLVTGTGRKAKNFVRILHKYNLEGGGPSAKDLVESYTPYFDKVEDELGFLAETPCTIKEMKTFLLHLFPDKETKNNSDKPERARNGAIRSEIFTEFFGSDGSWYDAYRSVASYIDYRLGDKGLTTDDENRDFRRMKSGWWGTGAQKKGKAYAFALKQASLAA